MKKNISLPTLRNRPTHPHPPLMMKVPILLILALVLTACRLGDGGAAASESAETVSQAPEAAAESPATQATTEAPVGPGGLPPDPQEIAFQASDGQALHGLYYPAASSPAPLVVFMHWVNGDMSDWYEIAPWLQNRGLANPFANPGNAPWWDPSWFPPVPEGTSYGVFIFSFRGCTPSGCPDWTPDVWLLDAQAAMSTAASLEGVDPAAIVAIGSSIGADGAPDACAWLDKQGAGSCWGALSLSPAGYMGIPYAEAVRDLGQYLPPAAAWCLADENEIDRCNTAADSGNPAFRAIEIPGSGHGTMLLRPGLDPLPMQLILDFLSETAGQ